jgi:hypothetical protein
MKRVDMSNWLEPDAAWLGTVGMEFTDRSNREWIEMVYAARLNASVPENIAVLFESAQGALIYSLFYHPLMTLALDQMTRLAERAATAKYEMEIGEKAKNFAAAIDGLIEQGSIATESKPRWTAVRKLRNDASHPSEQWLYSIGMMSAIVEGVPALINELFPDGESQHSDGA